MKRSSPEKEKKIAFLFFSPCSGPVKQMVLILFSSSSCRLPGLYWFVSLHNSYLSGNEPNGTPRAGKKKLIMCRKNRFENGNRLFSISRKSRPWAVHFSLSLSLSRNLTFCAKINKFQLLCSDLERLYRGNKNVCFACSKFLSSNNLRRSFEEEVVKYVPSFLLCSRHQCGYELLFSRFFFFSSGSPFVHPVPGGWRNIIICYLCSLATI